MKKILILSLLISCSQFFMSCENWFDVNPKSQVKNDILFENENGYKTALVGIYTTMATTITTIFTMLRYIITKPLR